MQVPAAWAIDGVTKSKYDNHFAQLELSSDAKVQPRVPVHVAVTMVCCGQLSGTVARAVLMSTGVDRKELRQIWTLADCDADGWLVRFEPSVYLPPAAVGQIVLR